VLVSYEPKREYQKDFLVKPTPIPFKFLSFLIGGVIITQHFFEPTREPAETKIEAIA